MKTFVCVLASLVLVHAGGGYQYDIGPGHSSSYSAGAQLGSPVVSQVIRAEHGTSVRINSRGGGATYAGIPTGYSNGLANSGSHGVRGIAGTGGNPYGAGGLGAIAGSAVGSGVYGVGDLGASKEFGYTVNHGAHDVGDFRVGGGSHGVHSAGVDSAHYQHI